MTQIRFVLKSKSKNDAKHYHVIVYKSGSAA